jgi:predicted MFS family arabinose efflux permease
MFATALLLSGSPSSVMVVTLIAFVLVDATFSMWNTTIASSLMKTVQNGKSGTLMGVNSSITSAGLLAGSIVSGQVTASYGYSTTFLLAFVTLAASFVMLSGSSRQKAPSLYIQEGCKSIISVY